ncbi:DNA gyrase subunit A [Prosthecobacter sp.]|uniref:DNA gyrase subunit A n=1 Tax=Prosthecobacter sp. TaxID=1965333 RepID=UPI002489921E|nr:DNA gyrase subunit A [Prosthecobacter sp.]MDI1314910.1 DNA gyrase subunit A [Prosthecobacter sp.]
MQDPNIRPISVAEEVKNSFLDYSMSVIIARALPDVRDGLKPSQRRILYAMHELSLYPPKKHMKCAKICGDTSGNYHPHGEAVIYPTLVHMGQPWAIREPLIDPQGNFGSVEGDPPAAMRYTEARMTQLGGTLMSDMEKETVDFVPNYDERLTEPSVFPAAFPNLIVNGGTGIAVGMATNMPPHNLGEVVDAVCAQIDNPGITCTELQAFIKGPDFPTGCVILGTNGIRDYLETGHGSVRTRGQAEIVENGNREQIIITEIPFNVNRAELVKRIAELANEKVIAEISGVRDESDENTRVVIDLKRDARGQVVLNNLYRHTALESSFSIHMLAIDGGKPRVLSMKDAIACYIEHRREVVIRRTRFLLKQAEFKAEKLEAQLLALGHLDDFIKIIRDSKNRDEARERLKAYNFSISTAEQLGIMIRGQASIVGDNYIFTDKQVEDILELRLYQLVGLERDKIKADYDEVLISIRDFMDILARESRVLQIIKDELMAIRLKHATPRMTRIEAAEGEIENIDLIPNDPAVVTMTHMGSIKRTSTAEYRVQNRGGKGLKGMETREAQGEEAATDFVEHLFSAHLHDFLLFFTNTGRMYVERVYQLPEAARTGKGRSIKNMLNLKPAHTVTRTKDGKEYSVSFPAEKIAAVLTLVAQGSEDEAMWAADKFVVFATKDGTVKKTALEEFKNYRKDGIAAINLDEGNDLVDVVLTDGNKEICLVTHEGMFARFHETGSDPASPTLRPIGRNTAGVRGITLDDGDFLVSCLTNEPDTMVLVVSENGLGKRTAFDEYRLLANRGGKGVTTMNVTEKTGKVVAAKAVHDKDELMLMTTKGQSVRIRVCDIRETGRNAQGVKLMGLKEGETIQDVATVVADEAEAVADTPAVDDTVAEPIQEAAPAEDTPAAE